MADRYQKSVELRPQNMSTGAAGGLMNLAGRLEDFKSTIQAESRRAGARIGAKKGAAVELETTKVDGYEVTASPARREASMWEVIAAEGEETRAYNRTVGAAYIASMANDNREAASSIEAQNKDDIQQFNMSFESYSKGVMETVDPALRGVVRQQLDDLLTSGRIRVQKRAETKALKGADAELVRVANESADAAARFSREGDEVQTAESLALFSVSIDQRIKSGTMDAASGALAKNKARLEVKEQRYRGEFDDILDNENPDRFRQAYIKLDSMATEIPKDWTPDQWDQYISSQAGDISAAIARNEKSKSLISFSQQIEISNLKILAKTHEGDPSEIIKKLDKATHQGLMPVSDRTTLISGLINRAKPGTGKAKLTKEQELEVSQLAVAVQQEIGEPKELMTQINDQFFSGLISGKERTSLVNKLYNQAREDLEVSESLNRVNTRLSGDNSQILSQDDVDLGYEELKKALPADAPTANAMRVQYVDDVKKIPTELKARIMNDLHSEDPDLIIQAADMIDRIDQLTGVPDGRFTATDRAYSESVAELVKVMEPKQAIELAKKATDPKDKARIELREKQIAEMKKTSYGFEGLNYLEVIDDEFDDVRPVDAAKLAKEYGVLFEANYTAAMNEDVDRAKEKSIELLKRNWGEYDGQYMKYPPTNYYQVQGDTDYIADQLYSVVRAEWGVGGDFGKDDIILLSDPDTARTASTGAPDYGVAVNINGEFIPMNGIRFYPDVREEMERIVKKNEAEAARIRAQPVLNQATQARRFYHD